VYEGFFFSQFDHPPTEEEHMFLISFAQFERFKELWVHLLVLYTLSSDPIKKRAGLSESEFTDTLSVQSPATLP